jgi:putative SOS response-associated peptidase YedK
MGMAGLWETWGSPAGERMIRSFTIIMTRSRRIMCRASQTHAVVLKPDMWPVWVGETPADVPQLKALLTPYPFR